MQWTEIFGYLGALLTLTTFSMKTMVHLRMVGIVANVAFITYGLVGPAYPVLLLQGEQGSAKSSAERLVRALVDPSAAPLRTTPRSEHDLYQSSSEDPIETMVSSAPHVCRSVGSEAC